LLLELKKVDSVHDSSLRVLRLVLLLLIATHLLFLAYNFYCIVVARSAELLTTDGYLATDLWMRSVRISLFFVIDVLCVFYWWQGYSTSAFRTQEDRKKIDLAIKEKDLLIKNLINANALIQTGAMTAGLSHEINQFLARIQLDVDSAKVQLANRGVDHVLAILNRVLAANTGAAVLVQNIKRLFVRQDEELTECDIDNLVESVAQFYLARAKLSKIVLTFDLHANVQVLIRQTLIQQVISNLVINAIDALDSVDRKDKKITLQTRLDGDRWVLRVTDNAQGVRPENAHKLFSLFSTSKNEGTGIGLWLSRYIVEQHGGYIRFANLEPEGVVFWVDMPVQANLSATELQNTPNPLLS
jgi:C4-dicarboxylate-specific signal transduction histidine kinase